MVHLVGFYCKNIDRMLLWFSSPYLLLLGPVRTFLGSRAVVAYSQPLTQICHLGKNSYQLYLHFTRPDHMFCGVEKTTLRLPLFLTILDLQENY